MATESSTVVVFPDRAIGTELGLVHNREHPDRRCDPYGR